MRILIDTNVYTAMRRGHDGVAALMKRSDAVLLSTVVAGELMYGFRRGSRFEQNRRDLMDFVDSPWVHLLQPSLVTADRFGMILASLKKKGRTIPTNDVWIAAHALESGADLASFDRHFRLVDGLPWLDPTDWV